LNHIPDDLSQWIRLRRLTEKKGDGQTERKRDQKSQKATRDSSDQDRKHTEHFPIRAPLGSSDESKSKLVDRRPRLEQNLPKNEHQEKYRQDTGKQAGASKEIRAAAVFLRQGAQRPGI
jgi:hypothetical protein